ncbi:hypothetical protein J5N97_022646 [Dioscorea zingiberensis]|uniref:Uncharacterized protein n=1 Tax=Dioscorea zingiberensis TaxID=325984 RepID=A0A9D5HAU7_9LILI|nr:hypothetical protein J5N97_022646 [Dioscorea zingiberensis]
MLRNDKGVVNNEEPGSRANSDRELSSIRCPARTSICSGFWSLAFVEASFCVESLLPMHSVTALALMNSMLCVLGHGYG